MRAGLEVDGEKFLVLVPLTVSAFCLYLAEFTRGTHLYPLILVNITFPTAMLSIASYNDDLF